MPRVIVMKLSTVISYAHELVCPMPWLIIRKLTTIAKKGVIIEMPAFRNM